MNAEDVAAEFERLAADCTMPSFAERRLVKARAIRALIAERDTFREALEIIAGRRQCLDNLMSNQEVAIAALDCKP